MGVFVSVGVVGVKQMQERLRQLGKKVPKSAKVTIYRFANSIITDAKRHYVPVAPDGGTLRASGIATPAEENGNTLRVVMGFGDGPSSAYALAVHEHLSEHSPHSWKAAEAAGHGIRWNVQGTGPKYLERPFLEATTGGKLESGLASDLEIEWNKA